MVTTLKNVLVVTSGVNIVNVLFFIFYFFIDLGRGNIQDHIWQTRRGNSQSSIWITRWYGCHGNQGIRNHSTNHPRISQWLCCASCSLPSYSVQTIEITHFILKCLQISWKPMGIFSKNMSNHLFEIFRDVIYIYIYVNTFWEGYRKLVLTGDQGP